MDDIKKLILLLPQNLKRKFISLFFFMVFLAFLEIVSIGAVVPVVGILIDPSFVSQNEILKNIFDYFQITNVQNYIYFALLVLLICYVLKSIFVVLLSYLKTKLAMDSKVDLSADLLEFYIRQDYEEYTRIGSYVLINNILKEIPHLIEGIVIPTFTILIEAITFLFILSFLLIYEPEGTFLIFLVILIYSTLYFLIFSNKTKVHGKIRQENEEKSNSQIVQSINGMKEIKLWNKENFFLDKYKINLKKVARSQTIQGVYQELPRAFSEVIGITVICVLSIMLIFQGKDFSNIMISLGFFAAAGFRLLPSVNRVMGAIHYIKFYHPSIKIINREFDKAKNLVNNNKKINNNKLHGEFNNITFKDVSFNYQSNKNFIFKNLNLKINKGDFVGILGKSGSGKSTFIDLLTSLLEPTYGNIYVDSKNLKDIQNEWKNLIGYVTQHVFISDTTLKKNIAFTSEDNQINEIDFKNSIKQAQITEFLDKLPNGENSLVGEKGLKLSGGQIQRVAIARCLYKNSKILIFDESTNALDLETEDKILETIKSLKDQKTIIMISHKINSLRYCNKILKIEDYNIFEQDN